MLSLTRVLDAVDPETADDTLTLPFELRQKSRLRATLGSGKEAAIVLPRGGVLRGGTCLSGESDTVVHVVAAPEDVSEVHTQDPHQLARVAYHLGNRHVPLQIGPGFVRYQHDHVLDDMVRALWLTVGFAEAPFEPEAGAYGGQGNGGGHGHGHGHAH
ncbi:MAG: urease accessory protein [Myxococcota bacterium]